MNTHANRVVTSLVLAEGKSDCSDQPCNSDGCDGDARSGVSRASLHPDISESEVMSFQFDDLIDRMEDKFDWDRKRALEVFEDLKRFLFLCGASTDGPFAPSVPIDEMWHNFILFTEDYYNFCQSFFKRFIHHRPRRRNDPKPRGNRNIILGTLEVARAVFGRLSCHWNFVGKGGEVLDANTYRGNIASAEVACTPPSTNCQDPDCHDSR